MTNNKLICGNYIDYYFCYIYVYVVNYNKGTDTLHLCEFRPRFPYSVKQIMKCKQMAIFYL